MNARAAFYQAGGAYGFRDQLQDVMALIHVAPEKVRSHILFCCEHQFEEGDVQHWWHSPSNAGVRTKITDDLLWLPYVVSFYIEKTGDLTVLDEVVSYLKMRQLESDEESVYAVPEVSEVSGTVLNHCIRAINKSLNFGAQGLPLMGTGDWNDGLNSVGDEGKGESVWLGWFLHSVLTSFVEILVNYDMPDEAIHYKNYAQNLRDNLNTNAWDGDWYKRAFHDDGSALGSKVNKECVIDSISQSWSIISGAGDEEKSIRAMESHELHLEAYSKGMILLLTPPFVNSVPFPGYIQGYPEGVRENGGQYTHGVVWAVRAYAMLKRFDKAYACFQMLNPINHTLNVANVMEYKTEPYIMTADVYSNPQHEGRGGWSWYTGSAGWMYQVAISDILGLKKYAEYILINPVLPDEWPGFELLYTYKNTRYFIKVVKNSDVTKHGVFVEGKLLSEGKIPLDDAGGDIEVQVIL